jgi:hypothetical protein
VGCGSEGEADLVPMFVHDPLAVPSCWTEEAIAAGGGTDMIAQMHAFQELNLEYNLQRLGLFIGIVLADPQASSWEVAGADGGVEWEALIEPVRREESYGELSFWLSCEPVTAEAARLSTCDGTRRLFSQSRSDSEATTLFAGSTTYRFNPWAREIQAPLVQREGDHTVTETGTLLRGCDPARAVSFARHADGVLRCWNRAGTPVSCAGVDLWPTAE